MTCLAIYLQRRQYEYKKEIGYQFVPGDLKCTGSNVAKLSLVGCIIGFITALTGIGAGVMTNAVLLRLDVHPLVASETGQAMGGLISFSASLCSLIYGQLKPDYGLVQAALAIIGTLIGMQC